MTDPGHVLPLRVAAERDAPDDAAGSSAERVYRGLRDRLLRGDVPAGSRLVELALAAEYETSRTPVREALRRLEGDGHLVRDPAGGLRPAVPSVRAMRELYDVRLALEDLTVRRACATADRGLLDELHHAWQVRAAERRSGRGGVDGPDFVHADETFHEGIARAAGNAVAERLLADLNRRIRILRIHDFTSADRIDATIAEHLEILEVVLTGDAEAAAAFMRSHVQRSALVVRERVGEVLTRMFGTPGD